MIIYNESLDNIIPEQLNGGFFVGWLNAPSPENHLRILQGSYKVWLALDGDKVVGFINAISDGILAAFIPLLEVLPEYQKQGIGAELTKRMIGSLDHLYSIDLLCDDNVIAFYERLGMRRAGGMLIRNYGNQNADQKL